MQLSKNRLDNNDHQDETKDKAKDDSKNLKKIDIEKYKDPEGLTVKHLNFGLWFVEHKHQLARLYISILILISVFTWSYFLYGFGHYFIYGMKQDKLMIDELVNTSIIGHDYFLERAARDLIIYPPQVLNTDQGKYDFIAKVQNPNAKHWGKINFSYLAGNVELVSGENFILPGDSKFLISLANELSAKPASVQLRINKLNWGRISPHDIRNFDDFKNQRLKIEVGDISFTPESDKLSTGGVRLNELKFTAKNNSAYSYWNTDFVILLYQRGAIIGVNEYSIEDFRSQTARQIRMNWPGRFGRVDQEEIIPEVNIMDPNNYILPEGGKGAIK